METTEAKRQLRVLLEEIAERMANVSILVESVSPQAIDAYGNASDALENLAAAAAE